MSTATEQIQHFWQDHAGARFLAPMLFVLSVTVIAIIAMLSYPYR